MPFRRTVHRDPLQHGWSFGTASFFNDSNQKGAHAGVPHALIAICHNGKQVGTIDVHMHHNQSNFSVGVTIHHQNSDEPHVRDTVPVHIPEASCF